MLLLVSNTLHVTVAVIEHHISLQITLQISSDACVCVSACRLQGLAPLKTAAAGGQQKPALSATQPVLKSLPAVHSNLTGKVR